MIILSRPSLDFKSLFKHKCDLSYKFKQLIFYSQGRHALLEALRLLKVAPGETIIVPAYICESSISLVRKMGYKIIFIDIQTDLKLDINLVYNTVKKHNAKAIIVVNYFGFSSNVSEIVNILNPIGTLVIEDNCHSFLSQDNKTDGLKADASIYSMRKNLPIPDGGALSVNMKHLKNKIEIRKNLKKPKVFKFFIFCIFEKIITSIGLPNIYSHLFDIVRNILKKFIFSKEEFFKPLPQTPSTFLNYYLQNKHNIETIKYKKIKNYNCMSMGLTKSGLKPYFPNLKDGCVPQWMLFYDPTKKIVQSLRRQGVGASYWPWDELPIEVSNSKHHYKISNELNSHLALLPIHQDIQISEINHIINLVDKLKND